MCMESMPSNVLSAAWKEWKALCCPPPPAYRSVVLLDDVVEELDAPSRELAEAWIERRQPHGTLTAYPTDVGVYE